MENISSWRPYPRLGRILFSSAKAGLGFALCASTILYSTYLSAISMIAGDSWNMWDAEELAAIGAGLAVVSVTAAVVGSVVGAWVGLCTAGLHANRPDNSTFAQLRYAHAGTFAGLVVALLFFAEPVLGYSVVTEVYPLGLLAAMLIGARLNRRLVKEKAAVCNLQVR